MTRTLFAVAASFAMLGTAHAQYAAPEPRPLQFVAGLGVSVGGDQLAVAHYTDGSSQNIRAGSGVYFTGGIDYHISPEFSLQATANFHVDQASAKNGDIKFQRFPIELIAYYQPMPEWRVGGGVRYVSNPKLTTSGAATGPDIKFDDTTSAVIETEYLWAPNFGVKIRYVNETYKSSIYKDFKANQVGISGNFYF